MSLISRTLIRLLIAASIGVVASAYAGPETIGYSPNPVIDARGFVDVWRLRDEVNLLERYRASDDTESCYHETEGDPSDKTPNQMSPAEKAKSLKQEQRAAQAAKHCEEEVKRRWNIYQDVRARFNAGLAARHAACDPEWRQGCRSHLAAL